MTKTEYEMQDFSWKNLGGWVIIFGIIGLASYLKKK